MNGQNSKDKYRKNKEASIKLQIEITEKEAKRIALTYATISLGAFGIGGFLTYLGCVGVYAGISTIKEFGILYLVCAMFIWLIIYLVINCAFHDEESYVYWFKQKNQMNNKQK